jgi:lysophospholipase L1-like esterase
MTFGDADEVSNATVKAELRRLMLEKVHTSIGEFATRSIVVNIRTPRIGGDGLVRLKDRERTSEAAAWDDKLTLEFNGDRPCLCAMEIERADDIPTVFLLGDSTVCDQPNEPWNSWGQMLTRFFKPQVAVANHAESGESLRSSLGAGRFRKVWSEAKPGDYLFIQFGHNDMKSRDSDALEQYKNQLKAVVREAKKRGVTAVLITSMERKSGVEQVTLGDYPATVRDVAVEGEATMIDLHAMSKILYRTLGPDLGKAFQDGTHHVAYGSYQLAKCVVQGIIDNKLELADFIVDDFSGYNPAHPDPVDGFDIPASPISSVVKPLGN